MAHKFVTEWSVTCVLDTVCGVVVMVMAGCTGYCLWSGGNGYGWLYLYCLWSGGNGYGWLYCILSVEWW